MTKPAPTKETEELQQGKSPKYTIDDFILSFYLEYFNTFVDAGALARVFYLPKKTYERKKEVNNYEIYYIWI